MTTARNTTRGVAALRRLTAPGPRPERCELCAAIVPEEHEHLVDPESRRLLCACNACAILFDHAGATKYRRVPRDIRELADFEIPDAIWNGFAIPIGLVFFFRSSASNGMLAVYPSPGGPAEIAVEEEDWNDLVPLASDVEALLVNRMNGAREYFIVPIDQCYKLVGLTRRHWTGLSGGDPLWEQIGAFFESLKRRAVPERSASHA